MWWFISTVREWESDSRTVFFHPVSCGFLPCFRCVLDSNDQFVIKLCWSVLEQRHSENMQVKKHCSYLTTNIMLINITVIHFYVIFLSKPQKVTAEGLKSRIRLKSHRLQTPTLDPVCLEVTWKIKLQGYIKYEQWNATKERRESCFGV